MDQWDEETRLLKKRLAEIRKLKKQALLGSAKQNLKALKAATEQKKTPPPPAKRPDNIVISYDGDTPEDLTLELKRAKEESSGEPLLPGNEYRRMRQRNLNLMQMYEVMDETKNLVHTKLDIPSWGEGDPTEEKVKDVRLDMTEKWDFSYVLVIVERNETGTIIGTSRNRFAHIVDFRMKHPDGLPLQPTNLVGEILNNILDEPNLYGEAYLENIVFRPINQTTTLANFKAQGRHLHEKFLGDAVLKIDTGKDECLIDTLYYLMSHAGMRVSRAGLREEIGVKEGEGVSPQELILWARKKECVSVYLLDSFKTEMYRYVAHKNKCRVSVVLYLSDKHWSPVLSRELVDDVIRTHKIDFSKLPEVDMRDAPLWDCKDLKNPIPGRVLLVEADDLSDLAQKCMLETGMRVEVAHPTRTDITMFTHPVTRQYIVAAPEYHKRKAASEYLFSKTKAPKLQWSNQYWSMLAWEHMRATVGELPKSHYGPDVFNIIKNTTVRPLTFQHQETMLELMGSAEQNLNDAISIDAKRLYTFLMMSMKGFYPVFNVEDQIEDLSESAELIPGLYWVEEHTMADPDKIHPADWYPLQVVEYLLENEYIERPKWVVRASRKLPCRHLGEWASNVHNTMPLWAKELINHLTGMLGKTVQTKTDISCTTSVELVDAVLNQYPGTCSIPVGNMYFLRRESERPLYSGHWPIWMTIVKMGHVYLDRMYKKVVGPYTKVLCYTTDAMKVINPLPFKEGNEPGDYQIERKPVKIFGKDYISGQGYLKPEREWAEVEESMLRFHENGLLLSGPGGSGKTVQMIKMARAMDPTKRATMAYTKQVVEVHNQEGMGAVTFDHAFPKEQPLEQSLERLKNKEAIFCDEFSMCRPYYLWLLWRLKQVNPSVRIVFAGDANQLPPEYYDEADRFNYVDPLKSALLYAICDGFICNLTFKDDPKMRRYDSETIQHLTNLLETGSLGSALQNRGMLKHPEKSVCLLPATRRRINYQEFQHFSKDKEVVLACGMPLYVGCPVIAKESRGPIINAKRYTVVGLDAVLEKLVLREPNGHMIWGTFEHAKSLRHGFCETVMRFQGGKIEQPFNIYDSKQMSLQQLYTALSRTTKWADVHVDALSEKYERETPEQRCWLAEPVLNVEERVIYHYLDEKTLYIGHTNDAKSRDRGHRTEPETLELAKLMEKTKMEIVAEFVCSRSDIEQEEKLRITRAILEGYELVNRKKVTLGIELLDSATPNLKEVKYVEPDVLRICDEPSRKRYHIRSRGIDKTFPYGKRPKEEALKEAEEFRLKMIQSM